MLDGEEPTVADRFTYLGSCVTKDVGITAEVNTLNSRFRQRTPD